MGAEQPDERVLGAIGVLEFVDQDELKALLIGVQPVRVLPKERQRVQQQVVEVHRVGGLERGAKGGIDGGGHLGQPVELGAGRQVRRRHHPVLRARDQRLHRAGRKQLGRVALLLHQPADEAQPVILIVDGELPTEAQQLGLAPQQPRREGVKGPDPESRRVAGEQPAHPLLHLAGGLVGEGDGEDPLGRHAVAVDQQGDPGGEHPGLPRAGAGQYQQRAVHVLDRLTLRRVERVLQLRSRGVDHAACAANGMRITKLAPLSVCSNANVPRCASSTTRRDRASPIPQPPCLLLMPG